MSRRTLNRTLRAAAGLLIAVVMAAPAAAQDEPAGDLTGEWIFTTMSPNGEGRRDVVIEQKGNELTGTIASSMAEGPLEGRIDGDQVIFTALVSMSTGDFEIVYTATLVGDELLDGEIDFGSYGAGTFTGRRKDSGGG